MLGRLLSPVSLDEVTYYPEPRSKAMWSEEEDKSFLELFHQGKTLKEMSDHLSRSSWSLLYRLYRLDQISEDATEDFLRLIRARQ
jgi:hypothetical protein